jgi:hypothetical protein
VVAYQAYSITAPVDCLAGETLEYVRENRHLFEAFGGEILTKESLEVGRGF